MNNLQNHIIQNNYFKSNYILINSLKNESLNITLKSYKRKLTINFNLKNFQFQKYQSPSQSFNGLFINNNLNNQLFFFKHNYSQTTSNDNNEEKINDNKEIPNSNENDTNKNTSDNEHRNSKNNKENNKPNIYSIALGLIAISAAGTLKVHKKVIEKRLEELENETQIKIEGSPLMKFYAMLPLRILSRFAGKVLNATVPEKYRERLYKAYAKKFNCNLDEMLDEDLTHYKSIAQFFYRKIKPNVRPIDKKAELVSPVDGRVLQFGEILNNEIEQVKGFTYSLNALLGYDGNSKKEKNIIFNKDKLIKSLNRIPSHVNMSHQKFLKTYSIDSSKDLEKMKENENYNPFSRHGNKLFYCVLYLSPGDYHHFHSPTNWIIEKRRHFSGKLNII